MNLTDIIADETLRNEAFPITRERIFMAHAGVNALPRVACQALRDFADGACKEHQEAWWSWTKVDKTRKAAAELLGCQPKEVALIGPTSMGLNLVANGIDWQPGDEVIYYAEDYPANVYPWAKLANKGVTPVALNASVPGVLTWDLIEQAITDKTRLVALASCHFLSGYRVDLETIGSKLHQRDILFSVDGIQTLGAFPMNLEHVDFLSADSHKWMLGPVGQGVFYVKQSRQELLQPSVLGAWNVVSPNYISQDELALHEGARRYEAGTYNLPGIHAMLASIELLLDLGIENIAARNLHLRRVLLDAVRPLGYQLYTESHDLDPDTTDDTRSSIVSITHPHRDMKEVMKRLKSENVTVSLRENRSGERFLRFSPHFYNTESEIERAVALL